MEKIRLQKFVADAGLMSRRATEAEIEKGNFAINGHMATLGDKVDPKRDVVTYRGERVGQHTGDYTYIMLNKPRGYLCSTSDDHGRKCVTDLLDGVSARVYPVGRLDLLSEGILLLTDDGKLKNRLTHPATALPKVYRVKVAGRKTPHVTDEQLARLASPLVIDGYRIRPVEVIVGEIDESGTILKMILTEGRNRQIRKMCEQVGLTVKRLTRLSIGDLKLQGMPVGHWRHLEQREIDYLYRMTRGGSDVSHFSDPGSNNA